jgi:hypothetical protein
MSLLRELKDEHPPFARCVLGLLKLLELATLPIPTVFEGSTFISEIFFTFFSWTCSTNQIQQKKSVLLGCTP